MNNEKEGVTAEEYKVRQLKMNMATRFADYEDVVASLQTQVAMLQQQVESLEANSGPEMPGDELDAPVAPSVPPE